MRALVTGGTGFIGSALVRRLCAAGHEVLLLSRSTSAGVNLGSGRDSVRFVHADLADVEGWHDTVARWQPERVFHLAWYAEPGRYLTDTEQNVRHLQAGIAFVRHVLAMRPRQFVCAGTCFEYDTSGEGSLREDTTPERPQHIYSACKLALKHVALQLAADAGLPLVWARVFYLYGPHEHPKRLVPLVERALRAGEPIRLRSHGRQLRDYLHVDDVAAGIDAAASYPRPGVVNIASGTAISVRDLTGRIAAAIGRPDLLSFAPDDAPFDEPMSVVGDATRLRALGWTPMHG